MSINFKDVLARAAKTFIQASGSLAIAQVSGINLGDGDLKNVILNILISAGAAGISAVWNGVILPLFKGTTTTASSKTGT
jgi:hypothetical protein